VELAREGLKHSDVPGHEDHDAMCMGIMDLLAEEDPCGFELPNIGPGRVNPELNLVWVPYSWLGGATPEDARHMARMLLRAADAADLALCEVLKTDH